MSEDEQQAQKAKLLLEWTDNKQELERRRAVAAGIADTLSAVASALRSQPELLSFSSEQTPSRYYGRRPMMIETAGLDVKAIQEVRDAIRQLEERQQELKPRLVAFGIQQP